MNITKKLRDITKEEALESYDELKRLKINKIGLQRTGLKALDYFFLKHRIKAKTKNISFYEAIRNKEKTKKLNELVKKYKKKSPKEYNEIGLLKARYQVFQLYYGSINQFRPIIAKWIYSLLKPKGILDFSSGWGGRLLSAMSMGIPYIGIDVNDKLESTYRKMIETLEPDANVILEFKAAEKVDYSKYKYDLVFTSPPYFMIERYEKMPKYKSKQDFLDTFFIPVIESVWKYLLPDGNMVLNIPKEMYEAIKEMLPKVKRVLNLPLSNRHPTNAVKKTQLGKIDKERSENMYVWHKV